MITNFLLLATIISPYCMSKCLEYSIIEFIKKMVLKNIKNTVLQSSQKGFPSSQGTTLIIMKTFIHSSRGKGNENSRNINQTDISEQETVVQLRFQVKE